MDKVTFLVSRSHFKKMLLNFPNHLVLSRGLLHTRFPVKGDNMFLSPLLPVLREQQQCQDTHMSAPPAPSTEALESRCIAAVLFPPPITAR